MTTSADLFAAAADLGRRARDCDDTATDLEVNARPLDGVLAPVIELHTSATWSSTAADNSRRTLAWQHLPAVDEVIREVAELARLLRVMACDLRADQRAIVREAESAAVDEWRAAQEAPANPGPAAGARPGGGRLQFS